MSETTVRVPLTVEQRADKADAMAGLVKRIEGIENEAKERAAEFRDEIKGLEAELLALANVVQEGAEQRSQLDLTFTEAEAARALAGVGAAAGEGPAEQSEPEPEIVPEAEHIEVETPKELAAARRFNKAKAKRASKTKRGQARAHA